MQVLNDVCHAIVDCPHSTAPDEGFGHPIIRTPNIGPGYLMLDGVQRVSEETYNARNVRGIPEKNDLILAREAPAGNVAIISTDEKVCLGQRTVLIKPNHELVDARYLNYYLNAPEQQHALLKNANGATVSHVNMPIIRELPIYLPSLKVQRRIADALSAYDELIENNRKQIKLLEEAAQRLYKEWFIDLRFPGHETTPINPETNLPEGWKRVDFDSILTVKGGGTPSTSVSEYWENGTIPWYTPKDFTGNTSVFLDAPERFITEEGLKGSSANLVNAGTILMTSRATIGLFGLADMPVCTNQGFILIGVNDENCQHYVLRNLMARVDEMKGLSKGSTFLELGRTTFKDMLVTLPAESVLTAFQNRCELLYRSERVCVKAVRNLIESRDRLLPKLMSGEIEV